MAAVFYLKTKHVMIHWYILRIDKMGKKSKISNFYLSSTITYVQIITYDDDDDKRKQI